MNLDQVNVMLSPLLNCNLGSLSFYCPGCKIPHSINVNPVRLPTWSWNADPAKPTFSPSILVTYKWGEEQRPVVCHSFVRDGQIQYLGDCTHELAGQTVDIPDYSAGMMADD